jgi:hypothetical protein
MSLVFRNPLCKQLLDKGIQLGKGVMRNNLVFKEISFVQNKSLFVL